MSKPRLPRGEYRKNWDLPHEPKNRYNKRDKSWKRQLHELEDEEEPSTSKPDGEPSE